MKRVKMDISEWYLDTGTKTQDAIEKFKGKLEKIIENFDEELSKKIHSDKVEAVKDFIYVDHWRMRMRGVNPPTFEVFEKYNYETIFSFTLKEVTDTMLADMEDCDKYVIHYIDKTIKHLKKVIKELEKQKLIEREDNESGEDTEK